ncbi:MAG: DUF1194 domain-containing protein [Rhizobiaceae bacterium]|nr:DUF1194 domain-containing protein [Rhizobiaceae bacterium]
MIGVGRYAGFLFRTIFCLALLSPGAQSQSCVDLALVLAVDGSSSIDAAEYRFQQQAISASLRDPEVLDVMASAGTVAIAVVFWGDPNRPIQESETVVIDDPADAERLAGIVEGLPRQVLGNTGLSTGLAAALDKLETMGCARRSVINVSGDGKGTILSRQKGPSPRLEEVRARADTAGVTINALAVSNEEPDLGAYYEQKVITGPGAFVMDIKTYDDYALALRRKLIREIAPMVVSRLGAR